ncbi:MAG: hypothetical protein J0L82_09285 [Deltaproteobacteria bacterium]|jgi:hypothetical protein|nr:hypothetical protein [Deltaproteobacteria bacterium]
MFSSRNSDFRTIVAACSLAFLANVLVSGCTQGGSTQLESRALDPYCPHLPSKTFPSPVNIAGQGFYEYRVGGNGVASDSGVVFTIDSFLTAATRTYSIEINGRSYSVQSSGNGTTAQLDVVAKLIAAINADTSAGLVAYGHGTLTVSQPGTVIAPTVGSVLRVVHSSTNPGPRPIRQAEILIKDIMGSIVQCAETADDGSFSFQLPMGGDVYSVELNSRSANSRSNTYVLNNPTDNRQHAMKLNINAATNINGILFRATVANGLNGGAFNILDQILNAQDYLRAATGSCDQVGHATYYVNCTPFTEAPLVKVYWSPGVSPSVYVGVSGSISYYLNRRRELYLQGGQSGNILSSDMDHFDNSVILHEYAHFLEDVFGAPNSPGGSHSGDGIVDPRLAWSEGWANFFQAAVTGEPRYRDTYGTPDCESACSGTYFDESLDPSGVPPNDAPTLGALGEGNFREFSVSRLLWDVIKPTGGVSRFAEIWRAFASPSFGMKAADDPFKTVGRFHKIQADLDNVNSWSSIRLAEEQMPGFWFYGTPFTLTTSGCSTSPIAMAPVRASFDDGSFARSDQFRSNDFYRIDHTGGTLVTELFYSKDSGNPPDLDIFIYRPTYVFGRSTDILLESAVSGDGCQASGSQTDTANPFRGVNGCPAPPAGLTSTYGYEKAAVSLAAGTYMINVKADTSIRAGASTNYVILLSGYNLCPSL